MKIEHIKSPVWCSACAADRAPQSFGLSGYHLSGCSLTNVPDKQKSVAVQDVECGHWNQESPIKAGHCCPFWKSCLNYIWVNKKWNLWEGLPDYSCSCSKLPLILSVVLFAQVVFVEAGVAAGHSFFGCLFGQKGGLGWEYGTMRFQPECWLSTRFLWACVQCWLWMPLLMVSMPWSYEVIWCPSSVFYIMLFAIYAAIRTLALPTKPSNGWNREFQRPFSLLGL